MTLSIVERPLFLFVSFGPILEKFMTRIMVKATAFAVCVFVVNLSIGHERAHAQWFESIGYNRLVGQLGSVENGAGISLSMGEADTNANPSLFRYMPNVLAPGLAGKNIVDGSGLNNDGPSTHATGQARFIFGDLSIAQGATDMTVYEAVNYLNVTLGFAGGGDPLAQPFKVQSHAWIGNGLSTADAENLLQRLDYMISQNEISVQVGINNGSSNAQPQLLGQAYNAISVGRTDGNHSRGFTTLYGSGRVMPDVVMDAVTTSRATSKTSSVMTVLHHKAVNSGNPDASRAVTMKSILMAGATKQEFPSWSRTTTQPLDSVFGAGEVNIYNSYFIIDGGETDGSTSVPAGGTIGQRGWDYGENIDPGTPLYYNFEVGPGEHFATMSIMLNWEIEITDGDPGPLFDPIADLANMSLRLFDSSVTPLGSPLDESLSPIENVEHIYFQDLTEGLYTIEVSTDRPTDFALAWNAVVPEPNSFVALAMVGLVCLGRRRKRRAS